MGLVEGKRFDLNVAAEIITGKYGYHLPFYRQTGLVRWKRLVSYAAEFVLRPVADYYR